MRTVRTQHEFALDSLYTLGSGSKLDCCEWASVYSDEESKQVKAISQRTAEFLSHNPKSKSAQIAAWIMVLNNPVDSQTRKLAIKRISTLGGKVSVTPQGSVQILPPKED